MPLFNRRLKGFGQDKPQLLTSSFSFFNAVITFCVFPPWCLFNFQDEEKLGRQAGGFYLLIFPPLANFGKVDRWLWVKEKPDPGVSGNSGRGKVTGEEYTDLPYTKDLYIS